MLKSLCRKLLLMIVAGGCFALSCGVDLAVASAGDKMATGVIVENGRGSIIIKITSGEEVRYHLGRGTNYVPSDYRQQEGDTVKVTYYNKDHRGNTIKAVSTLELIKANPNIKEPPNPAVGTIKEAGRRILVVYVPAIDTSWDFEKSRGWQAVPRRWKPAAGEKVKVTYQKVPSRFGSGYVYSIKTIEQQ